MCASNTKRAAFTLILLLVATRAAPAQRAATWESVGLKGPVKSVREYEAKFGREGGRLVEGKRTLFSVETYDARGLQLTNYYYKSDGSGVLDGDTNTYDASGRLKETAVEHSPHVYLPDRRVYAYDAVGNMTGGSSFAASGALLGRYVYEYDERCRLTRSDSIAEGENQVFDGHKRTTYTYDEGGRVVGQATFTVEGETLKPEDYRLGYQKTVFLYAADGRRATALRLTEDGKFYSATATRYDPRGEVAEETEYDSEGGVRSRKAYSYEYDARGNWVKQTTSEWVTRDGKSFFEPEEVSYREITYYGDAEARAAVPRTSARGCVTGARTTDAEEYAVYSAVVADMLGDAEGGLYVVSKYTSAEGVDDPAERRALQAEDSFLAMGFDREALADYVSKNTAAHYELIDEMLKLGAPHRLVTDDETEEMFAGNCEKGWEKFYGKYRGAQGHMTLSRVGFNRARDAAVVYYGNQSHCLAGAGYFVHLKKVGGVWKVSRKTMAWIS